jgi:hypothetical protein
VICIIALCIIQTKKLLYEGNLYVLPAKDEEPLSFCSGNTMHAVLLFFTRKICKFHLYRIVFGELYDLCLARQSFLLFACQGESAAAL